MFCSGPDLMARGMKQLHPRLKRGDVFLHNSPYHGNSHPADHTMLVPVIDDDGVHRFTVVAKAHQADIGNSIPTTYHGTARDVYEEGALIFPAVQVSGTTRPTKTSSGCAGCASGCPTNGTAIFLPCWARRASASANCAHWERSSAGLRSPPSRANGWTTRKPHDRSHPSLPAVEARRSRTHDAIPGTPKDGIDLQKSSIDPDECDHRRGSH